MKNQNTPSANVDKKTAETSKPEASKPEASKPATSKPAAKKPSPSEAATKTATKKAPSSSHAPSTKTPSSARTPLLLAGVAILIAFASLAINYVQWQKLTSTNQQLDDQALQTQTKIEALTPRFDNIKSEAQTRSQAANNTLIKQFDEKLSRTQSSLQMAIDAIEIKNTPAITHYNLLDETEFLLQHANNRLLLEGDIRYAGKALSTASLQLKRVDKPAFTRIRQQIASELTALDAVPQPDYAALSGTLSSLQTLVTQLPLAQPQQSHESITADSEAVDDSNDTTSSDDTLSWQSLLDDITTTLSELVTIRRTDIAPTPLLAPNADQMVRQNLQLKLESARLAIFRKDERSYQQDLTTAQQWLSQYFDLHHDTTTSIKDRLAQLQTVKLINPLPDISTSLMMLRQLKKTPPSTATHDGAAQ